MWSTEPQGGNNDAVRTFDYDDLGRLTGWSVYDRILDPESCTEDPEYGFICTDESSRTLVQDTDFSYDLAGNRTDLSATIETGNRLTAFDGYTLAYDSAGNLKSKSGNGQNVTFSWNALGQLTSVSTSSDTLTFEYDAFGRRVSKDDGSATIAYIYDGQQVLAELDGSENIDAVYTYYPGIDRPHMMERGGSRYYYGFDVPGNVLGLFDGTGIVNKYVHTPFGQADTTSQSVTNPYRYMSRRYDEYDENSGLYFMRARYYDPDLARFVSEDPIGLMGGINTYAFAGNDPANSRDPMGLCPEGYDPDEYDCYYLDGLTATVSKKDAQDPFMSDEEWNDYVERQFGGTIRGPALAGLPSLGGGPKGRDRPGGMVYGMMGRGPLQPINDDTARRVEYALVRAGPCVERYTSTPFGVGLLFNAGVNGIVASKGARHLGASTKWTNWQHLLGEHWGLGNAGRAAGRIACAVTVADGVYSIGIVGQCMAGTIR